MSQPKFSLAVALPSKDPTVPLFDQAEQAWHRATKCPICAYSSTANGYFATNGERGRGGWDGEVSRLRLLRATRIAAELRVTPNQVGLAWLLHQGFPVIPVLGTGDPSHLADALAADAIPLSEQHMSALTNTAP